MVCPKCKEQKHELCPGGTWCDCQHKVPAVAKVRKSVPKKSQS
jgi:hypothetical protein